MPMRVKSTIVPAINASPMTANSRPIQKSVRDGVTACAASGVSDVAQTMSEGIMTRAVPGSTRMAVTTAVLIALCAAPMP